MKIVAFNAQQGYQELLRLWSFAKPLLLAGHRLVLEVREATRTSEQNAKFHAICSDIAKSGKQWAGKERTAAQWKVLLVSGHGIATAEGTEIVPGLESEFVSIRESTALMSIKRGSSLIDYSLAWCAQNDIRLSAPEMENA